MPGSQPQVLQEGLWAPSAGWTIKDTGHLMGRTWIAGRT